MGRDRRSTAGRGGCVGWLDAFAAQVHGLAVRSGVTRRSGAALWLGEDVRQTESALVWTEAAQRDRRLSSRAVLIQRRIGKSDSPTQPFVALSFWLLYGLSGADQRK